MNWRIKQQLRSIIVDLVGWLQFLPPRIRTRQPLARGVGVVTTDFVETPTPDLAVGSLQYSFRLLFDRSSKV